MAQLNQLDCGKRALESVFLPTSKVVLKALKTGATDPRLDPFKKKDSNRSLKCDQSHAKRNKK